MVILYNIQGSACNKVQDHTEWKSAPATTRNDTDQLVPTYANREVAYNNPGKSIIALSTNLLWLPDDSSQASITRISGSIS